MVPGTQSMRSIFIGARRHNALPRTFKLLFQNPCQANTRIRASALPAAYLRLRAAYKRNVYDGGAYCPCLGRAHSPAQPPALRALPDQAPQSLGDVQEARGTAPYPLPRLLGSPAICACVPA